MFRADRRGEITRECTGGDDAEVITG